MLDTEDNLGEKDRSLAERFSHAKGESPKDLRDVGQESRENTDAMDDERLSKAQKRSHRRRKETIATAEKAGIDGFLERQFSGIFLDEDREERKNRLNNLARHYGIEPPESFDDEYLREQIRQVILSGAQRLDLQSILNEVGTEVAGKEQLRAEVEARIEKPRKQEPRGNQITELRNQSRAKKATPAERANARQVLIDHYRFLLNGAAEEQIGIGQSPSRRQKIEGKLAKLEAEEKDAEKDAEREEQFARLAKITRSIREATDSAALNACEQSLQAWFTKSREKIDGDLKLNDKYFDAGLLVSQRAVQLERAQQRGILIGQIRDLHTAMAQRLDQGDAVSAIRLLSEYGHMAVEAQQLNGELPADMRKTDDELEQRLGQLLATKGITPAEFESTKDPQDLLKLLDQRTKAKVNLAGSFDASREDVAPRIAGQMEHDGLTGWDLYDWYKDPFYKILDGINAAGTIEQVATLQNPLESLKRQLAEDLSHNRLTKDQRESISMGVVEQLPREMRKKIETLEIAEKVKGIRARVESVPDGDTAALDQLNEELSACTFPLQDGRAPKLYTDEIIPLGDLIRAKRGTSGPTGGDAGSRTETLNRLIASLEGMIVAANTDQLDELGKSLDRTENAAGPTMAGLSRAEFDRARAAIGTRRAELGAAGTNPADSNDLSGPAAPRSNPAEHTLRINSLRSIDLPNPASSAELSGDVLKERYMLELAGIEGRLGKAETMADLGAIERDSDAVMIRAAKEGKLTQPQRNEISEKGLQVQRQLVDKGKFGRWSLALGRIRELVNAAPQGDSDQLTKAEQGFAQWRMGAQADFNLDNPNSDHERQLAVDDKAVMGLIIAKREGRQVDTGPDAEGLKPEQRIKLESIMMKWEKGVRAIYLEDNEGMTNDELDAIVGGLRRSKRAVFVEAIKNPVKK